MSQHDAQLKQPLPRWWRALVVALGVLVLCSCKAPVIRPLPEINPAQATPAPQPPTATQRDAVQRASAETAATPSPAPSPPPVFAPGAPPPNLPGMPAPTHAAYPPGYYPVNIGPVPPLPEETLTPWNPPGMARPVPADEYLRDGGDRGLPARAAPDWMIHGLETEDTIVQYDTLDGAIHVEPSNRVHIYAPRFAAVRSVVNVQQENQVDQTNFMHGDRALIESQRRQPALSNLQSLEAVADVGRKQLTEFRVRQGEGVLSRALFPKEFANKYLPFEDLSIIRFGIFKQADSARLAIGRNAAITWSNQQAVQLVVDGVAADSVSKDEKLGSVFSVDTSRGPAKLRVIKVASEQTALPGETVNFTIRFDNIGDQPIGNVTVVDNLTTRLEYIPGTAQSSRKSEFLTQPNEGGSLVLRWEITDPLPVGAGGVVRFQCRVR